MLGWLLFTQMGNVGVWWMEPEIFLWDKLQANFYRTLHLEHVWNDDHGDQIGSQTFYFLWKPIMNTSYDNTRTGCTWRQDLFLSNLRTVSVCCLRSRRRRRPRPLKLVSSSSFSGISQATSRSLRSRYAIETRHKKLMDPAISWPVAPGPVP